MVKLSSFLLCVAFLLSSSFLTAQTSYSPFFEPGRNKISVDLFTTVVGRLPFSSEYGLTYHRQINDRMEWNARLAYSSKNALLTIGRESSLGINGVSLGGAWHYFINPDDRLVCFVGAEANYTYAHYENLAESQAGVDLSKLSGAILLGYRVQWFWGLEVDVYVGLGGAMKNYFWKRNDPSGVDNTIGAEEINVAWLRSFQIFEGNETDWRAPVGLRIGRRF